jgi:hypothetical protein
MALGNKPNQERQLPAQASDIQDQQRPLTHEHAGQRPLVPRRDWHHGCMSWDVLAFAVPPGIRRIEELPMGYQAPPLGSRDELIAAICRVAPHVDASDPTWLVLQGPDHLMEVGLGEDNNVVAFMFFVRSGDGSVPVMLAIADAVGAVLLDTSTGELMTVESGTASLHRWERYRDRVTGQLDP